ncbi:MAG: hypothetical protein AABY22_28130 [Nanoarchaeota archaeon]
MKNSVKREYGVFYKDGNNWRCPFAGRLFPKSDCTKEDLKDYAYELKRKVKFVKASFDLD